MTQFQVLKCSEILLSAFSSCVRVLYKIVLLSVVSKSRDGAARCVYIFEFAVLYIKISSHF